MRRSSSPGRASRLVSWVPFDASPSSVLAWWLTYSAVPRALTPTSFGEISTRSLIPGWTSVPDQRLAKGILDTSVVIDLERIEPLTLPVEVAVTAITMAELAAGPHATTDPAERARRQDRLQRAEAAFDALPFDSAAARAYGLIYSAVIAKGRKARGARAVDLLIAAVAAAQGIPLVTRNPEDFGGLSSIVTIVEI